MIFMKYKELKKIEKANPKAAKKALLRSMIIALTIATVLVVLAPMIQGNILFVSLFFGFASFFTIYSATMIEIKLLALLGENEDNDKGELNNA